MTFFPLNIHCQIIVHIMYLTALNLGNRRFEREVRKANIELLKEHKGEIMVIEMGNGFGEQCSNSSWNSFYSLHVNAFMKDIT